MGVSGSSGRGHGTPLHGLLVAGLSGQIDSSVTFLTCYRKDQRETCETFGVPVLLFPSLY